MNAPLPPEAWTFMAIIAGLLLILALAMWSGMRTRRRDRVAAVSRQGAHGAPPSRVDEPGDLKWRRIGVLPRVLAGLTGTGMLLGLAVLLRVPGGRPLQWDNLGAGILLAAMALVLVVAALRGESPERIREWVEERNPPQPPRDLALELGLTALACAGLLWLLNC